MFVVNFGLAWCLLYAKEVKCTNVKDSPVISSIFSFPVPSGAPRQLKFRVVNSSSIVVRWSEPLQQQDGRIQGYSVFYQKVDDQGNQLNPPPLPEVKYSESWNSLVSIPCLKFQKVVFDEEHLRACRKEFCRGILSYFDRVKSLSLNWRVLTNNR